MEINHTVNDQSYLFTISYWFSNNSDDYNYLHNAENYPLNSYSLIENSMNAINDNNIENWISRDIEYKGLSYGDFYKSDTDRPDNGLTWKFTIYHPKHNRPIGGGRIDCVSLGLVEKFFKN